MRPTNLLLRCYARQMAPDRWYAVCVDLNLDAEAPTFEEVRQSLDAAIRGYLLTVLETDEPPSLVHLLDRPAPLKDRVTYHLIKWFSKLTAQSPKRVAFQDPVPIHLAHACA